MKVLNFIDNNKVIDKLREFSLNEDGILPILDIENIKKEDISKNLGRFLEDNDKVVSIASSHLITSDLVGAFAQKFNNTGVILFDAHPDCLSKDDVVPVLASIIKKESIILIGNRNWRKEEYSFLRENRIRFFDMKKIVELKKEDIVEMVMETSRKFGALYVSIDLDVLEPAFAPGINCLEPCGLSSRDLLFFIQKLKLLKNLKAVDITEYNPNKDVDDITAKLISKLIIELA